MSTTTLTQTIEKPETIKVSSEFAPKYDFIESREMTVSDFFGTLFVEFAKYRANQRIPRLDGLAETQRKIIWTALTKNYSKKYKLLQVMADVNLVAKYHHGTESLADTMNNLIAPYKNNLQLLRPDGSFGSRTIRSAAAFRYTETRSISYLKKLFPLEDIAATCSFRSVDGDPAEPLTLFPIIPIGIINGQSQAAVGFSTNLLPRDPLIIIDLLIDILTQKVNTIPNHIPPSWPYFKGDVELVGKNKWEVKGKVRKIQKGKRKAIEIYEVPHSWSKDTLIKKLTALKENGTIETWNESCKGNSFTAEVVSQKLWNLDEDTIVEKLELTKTETERFVYIASEEETVDEAGNIKAAKDKFELHCDSIAVYINYFIKKRILVYEERKKYRLAKKLWEIQRLIGMINYINEVNAGKIEIRNKTEEEVIEQLLKYPKEYNFVPVHERFVYGSLQVLQSKPTWNYLFDFKTRNFTPDAIKRLNAQYQTLYAEYTETLNKTSASLWYEDLIDFREEYLKFLKENSKVKTKD